MNTINRRSLVRVAAVLIGALPFARETTLAEQIEIPDTGIDRFESVTGGEFWAPHELPIQMVPPDAYGWTWNDREGVLVVRLDSPHEYDLDGLFLLGAHDMYIAKVVGIQDDGAWQFRYL